MFNLHFRFTSNKSYWEPLFYVLPDIGIMVRVLVNGQETWVQSQVESYQRLKKWDLMPPCLTLSIIRYGSRVKWVNPGKGVVPSLTPWCSSYRKGSLRVTLDYGRQLYFLLFTLFYVISIIHLRYIREVFSDALSSLPISGYFCIISAPTVTPAWLWKSQAASVIATCYASASTKAKKNK